jgi:hypothetical protein
MGSGTVPLLKKTLAETNSAEVRRRINELLDKFKENAPGEELRWVRVIDILEHINSPPSGELLQAISEGGWGPAYGEAAKAALLRIQKQGK